MEQNNKYLWMRAGLNMLVNDDEARTVLTDEGPGAQELVEAILKEGRFFFDGSSYIPEQAIFDYNEKHTTDFPLGKPEFELPRIGGFVRVNTADGRLEEAACHILQLNKGDFIRCQQCLCDNGVSADETATVLQALCYMLLGVETEDLLDWDGTSLLDS